MKQLKVHVYKPCSLYWEAETSIGSVSYFRKFYDQSDAEALAAEMRKSTVGQLEEMVNKGQLQKGFLT